LFILDFFDCGINVDFFAFDFDFFVDGIDSSRTESIDMIVESSDNEPVESIASDSLSIPPWKRRE
jgi:hypothetical protein